MITKQNRFLFIFLFLVMGFTHGFAYTAYVQMGTSASYQSSYLVNFTTTSGSSSYSYTKQSDGANRDGTNETAGLLYNSSDSTPTFYYNVRGVEGLPWEIYAYSNQGWAKVAEGTGEMTTWKSYGNFWSGISYNVHYYLKVLPPPNATPTKTNRTFTMDETDGISSSYEIGDDSDNNINYVSCGSSTYGTLNCTENGSNAYATFDPSTDVALKGLQTQNISFTIKDTYNAQVTGTITTNVTYADDNATWDTPPTNQTLSGSGDLSYNWKSGANDPDTSDSITYTYVSGAPQGDPSVAQNYSAEDEGIYTVTVKAIGSPNEVVKIFELNISNVNNAPTIGHDSSNATSSVNVTENTTFVASMNATDADGDDINYTLSGTHANQFIITSDGNLSFITAKDHEVDPREYNVTVTVKDDSNASDTQDLTVTVTDAVNESPIITSSATFTANENQTSVGTLTSFDGDGDTVTYSFVAGYNEASFDIDGSTSGTSGVLTFKVAPDYEVQNSYQVRIKATDDGTGNLSDERIININVQDVNEAPILTTPVENISSGWDFFSSQENGVWRANVETPFIVTKDGNTTISYKTTSGNDISANTNNRIINSTAQSIYLDYYTQYSMAISSFDGTIYAGFINGSYAYVKYKLANSTTWVEKLNTNSVSSVENYPVVATDDSGGFYVATSKGNSNPYSLSF